MLYLFLLAANIFANPHCDLLDKSSIALSVHASNWANAITTRTPEGGPYKYQSLVCNPNCEVVHEEKTILKYEPNHPDANQNGYVNYPMIDKEKEAAAMTSFAQMIRLLSKRCAKTKIDDNASSALIRYKTGKIKFDTFNFDQNNNLRSWVRETKDGMSSIVNL
ncbi:MAG: hypothetical protein KDD37_11890 [Bdellovibrionales bacterium]|nr:hypothetical protein [Bdellovibrionales bacterium]